MATITVLSLIQETRQLSTLRNNQFFTDNDIGVFISDAAKELYDELIATYEHYALSTFDFTLSNSATVDLPDDFYKANILLRNPTQSNPQRVPMLGNFLNQTGVSIIGNDCEGRRWQIYNGNPAQLKIYPSTQAAGNYQLIYTPQIDNIWPISNTDFTVDVCSQENYIFTTLGGPGPGRSFTINPNPGSQLTINGVPLIGAPTEEEATIVLFKDQADPSENGIFRCSESDPGGTVFYRIAGYDQNSELSTGTSVLVTGGTFGQGIYIQTSTELDIDVDPLTWEVPTLPLVMNPWVLYLKTHAAISIMTARQQNTQDLQIKLAALKERVIKLANNRSEEPTRAPIFPRGRGRNFSGDGY